MFYTYDNVVSDDKAKRKKPSSSSLSSSSRRRRDMMVIFRIQGEDVRCVGEISLMTALLRAGVVNDVITWERM